MAALLHRARDLPCLPDNQNRYLWSQLSRAGYLRKEPSPLDIQPEPPTLLADVIYHYTNDLWLSLDECARLVSLYPDHSKQEWMKSVPASSKDFASDVSEAISEAIAEVEQILRANGKP